MKLIKFDGRPFEIDYGHLWTFTAFVSKRIVANSLYQKRFYISYFYFHDFISYKIYAYLLRENNMIIIVNKSMQLK